MNETCKPDQKKLQSLVGGVQEQSATAEYFISPAARGKCIAIVVRVLVSSKLAVPRVLAQLIAEP